MIGLDTTAIIDSFRGSESLKKCLEEKGEYVTTRINYLEVIWGLDLENNASHQWQYEFYEAFFKSITILELDSLSCQEAARLRWLLRRKGEDLDQLDGTIAAILFRNNVKTILTRNVKDFSKIPGMKVIKY